MKTLRHLTLATICIAARARPNPAATPFDPARLPGVRWLPVELPAMPVSATEIRARVAAGLDIAPLVPPGVASYIAQHSLYRTA